MPIGGTFHNGLHLTLILSSFYTFVIVFLHDSTPFVCSIASPIFCRAVQSVTQIHRKHVCWSGIVWIWGRERTCPWSHIMRWSTRTIAQRNNLCDCVSINSLLLNWSQWGRGWNSERCNYCHRWLESDKSNGAKSFRYQCLHLFYIYFTSILHIVDHILQKSLQIDADTATNTAVCFATLFLRIHVGTLPRFLGFIESDLSLEEFLNPTESVQILTLENIENVPGYPDRHKMHVEQYPTLCYAPISLFQFIRRRIGCKIRNVTVKTVYGGPLTSYHEWCDTAHSFYATWEKTQLIYCFHVPVWHSLYTDLTCFCTDTSMMQTSHAAEDLSSTSTTPNMLQGRTPSWTTAICRDRLQIHRNIVPVAWAPWTWKPSSICWTSKFAYSSLFYLHTFHSYFTLFLHVLLNDLQISPQKVSAYPHYPMVSTKRCKMCHHKSCFLLILWTDHLWTIQRFMGQIQRG